MRDYNQNRGGGARFGGRSGGRPMHQTVCANCGKDCEVPFRPTGERPVLCNDCFAQERGVSNGPRRFDGGSRPQSYGNRLPQSGGTDLQKQFDEVNSKLESIIEILESMNMPAKKKKTAVKAKPEPSSEPESPVEVMPEEPAVGDLLPQEEES